MPAQSTKMDNRAEFRKVLGEVVRCLRSELAVPGVSPFNAEELNDWFHNITVEDIQNVWNNANPDDNNKD